MRKNQIISLVTLVLFSLILIRTASAQDINTKNILRKSINSTILKETRNILIHLPKNYDNSNKTYPVIYLLDGNKKLLKKTLSTVKKLSYIPEIIIVAIESPNRDRDMWPVNTKYFPEANKPGAKDFLSYIEREVIPYIENNFRVNQQRIICGQSLSGVFTLYTFLAKPYLFDSYLVCSGAFPGCEQFFKDLSNVAFQKPDQYIGKKIFITHGLKDPLDPDGTVHRQMTDFSKTIKGNLGDKISCKYSYYKNEGHVPKNSFRDGLEYIFETNKNSDQ